MSKFRKINGLITPPFTPFTADGREVNYDIIPQYAELNVIAQFGGNIVAGKRIMKFLGLDLGLIESPSEILTLGKKRRSSVNWRQ